MICDTTISVSCKTPRYANPIFETKYQDFDIKVYDSDPYEYVIVYCENLAVAELMIATNGHTQYEESVDWVIENYDKIKTVADEKKQLPVKTQDELKQEYDAQKKHYSDWIGEHNNKNTRSGRTD